MEAIGLKDTPASNGEYIVLVKGRKFQDSASTWNGRLNRQSGDGHSHSQ